jgi:beta-lactamase superfamily II metal-dependent hydrolase
MFEIEMLPAREGDCLWIRYGSARAPRQVLIDAGRSATFRKDLRNRLLALPPKRRSFELFIITHVDRDHIEGSMELLEDPKLSGMFKDVWFNGYDHLKSAKLETFGAVQGERVTAALLTRKKKWNAAFRGKAVALRGTTFVTKKVPGGLTLTLLSPDRQKLIQLIPTWEKECREAGIIPGKPAKRSTPPGLEEFGAVDVEQLAAMPFVPDATRPNGTSIAVLARYGGKRAILAADAHVDRMVQSVKALGKGKRLKIDLLKVSHHGSEGNISREFLEAIDCPTYLISTNGSYFKHPKAVAIARVLKYGGKRKTIHFNYTTKFTQKWRSPALQQAYGYEVVYPQTKDTGTLTVHL